MKVLTLDLPSVYEGLESNGIITKELNNAPLEEIREWIETGDFDACLFNVEAHGFDVKSLTLLRNMGITVPFIGVRISRKKIQSVRTQFLDRGGDDLVVFEKTCRELVATIRACHRRAQGSMTDILCFIWKEMELIVDRSGRRISLNGIAIRLSEQRWRLLEELATANGRILTREYLLPRICEDSFNTDFRLVDSQIKRIRMAFRLVDPNAGGLIETVYNLGYRIPRDSGTLRYL